MLSTQNGIIAGRRSGHAAKTVGAVIMMALLGACQSPSAPLAQTARSTQRIGDVCQETMSFDVSGFYFPKCVEYLSRHAQPEQQVAAAVVSEAAEHRACHQIGLADGSPEYQSCVQEMVQLDLGAGHL